MYLDGDSNCDIVNAVPLPTSRIRGKDDRIDNTSTQSEVAITISTKALSPQHDEKADKTERSSAVIDSNGGMVQLNDARLQVPEGALPKGKEHTISISLHNGNENGAPVLSDNAMLIGPWVHCEPSGLQFLKPVTITLPHSARNILQRNIKILMSSEIGKKRVRIIISCFWFKYSEYFG